MGKVVLAYSGGLETTAAIHWLKTRHNLKVIALSVNVGQGRDLDVVAERAIQSGADAVHVFDVRRTFIKKFCWKALKAGARYEGVYLLSAALSRPLIATEIVRLAHDEGAPAVAHGAPPKGNDQFRLECSVAALDPKMEILAPLREWPMRTREEVFDYARKYHLDVGARTSDVYTRDENIWGARSAGGPMVDLSIPAPDEAFIVTTDPLKAPDTPLDITIGFLKGDPVTVDGKRLEPIAMMEALNEMGARHGVGRVETVENRLMGFKNREVYEAPGAAILYAAHDALERLVLDKDVLNLKRSLATTYAGAVYSGNWFSTLRESLDAFVTATQEFMSGEITVRLYKGTTGAICGASEFSTYDRELASLGDEGDALPEGAAEGMLAIARLLQVNHAFKQKPRL